MRKSWRIRFSREADPVLVQGQIFTIGTCVFVDFAQRSHFMFCSEFIDDDVDLLIVVIFIKCDLFLHKYCRSGRRNCSINKSQWERLDPDFKRTKSRYSPMTWSVMIDMEVGAFLKSTRHLYTESSWCLMLSSVSRAGLYLARNRARPVKTVSSDQWLWLPSLLSYLKALFWADHSIVKVYWYGLRINRLVWPVFEPEDQLDIVILNCGRRVARKLYETAFDSSHRVGPFWKE